MSVPSSPQPTYSEEQVLNASNGSNPNGDSVDVEHLEKQLSSLNFDAPSDPPEVLRRLKAMKKLQVEMLEAECEFFKELHTLEGKYSTHYKKLCDKRGSIISGKYEPSPEECNFSIPGCTGEEDEGKDKAPATPQPEVSGIPQFWLTVFNNVPQVAEMIEEADTSILEHLEDVKVDLTKDPLGFKLEFKFAPNPYFTNSTLTKTYEMKCEVDSKDPFSFEGPEIVKSLGCTIDWKEGKNVTVRAIKKKQKHKQSGAIRMVTKYEPCSSFFNFFSPPQAPDGPSEEEEDAEEMERLATDFQVGQYLRERVIPRAVLYYTGEIAVSDDEDDDYSTEGESEEESEGTGGEESEGTGGEEEEEERREPENE